MSVGDDRTQYEDENEDDGETDITNIVNIRDCRPGDRNNSAKDQAPKAARREGYGTAEAG